MGILNKKVETEEGDEVEVYEIDEGMFGISVNGVRVVGTLDANNFEDLVEAINVDVFGHLTRAQQEAKRNEVCYWCPDGDTIPVNEYQTECGYIHVFPEGETLLSMHFEWCPYCGKPTKQGFRDRDEKKEEDT